MMLKKTDLLSMKQCHLIMILFFIISLLAGCVNDDQPNCIDSILVPPDHPKSHYMTFEYSKNTQGIDLFPSMVEELDVYVFDSEGHYVTCISDEGPQLNSLSYTLPIDLPDGTYTFVVWSGARNHYQITDQYNNNGQSLQTGITELDQLRLRLNTNNADETDYPENLFFGIAEQISIDAKKLKQVHVELVKNTKNIHLTVEGIQYIKQTTKSNDYFLDITCNIANGELLFDNSISLPERPILYKPVDQIYNENTFECNIRTLRLLTDMRSELTIKNSTTGEDIFNDSLIELILFSPHINNNTDLNKNDKYDIVISIGINLDITITINGYTVLDNVTDL